MTFAGIWRHINKTELNLIEFPWLATYYKCFALMFPVQMQTEHITRFDSQTKYNSTHYPRAPADSFLSLAWQILNTLWYFSCFSLPTLTSSSAIHFTTHFPSSSSFSCLLSQCCICFHWRLLCSAPQEGLCCCRYHMKGQGGPKQSRTNKYILLLIAMNLSLSEFSWFIHDCHLKRVRIL